jgi:hypothetical protein
VARVAPGPPRKVRLFSAARQPEVGRRPRDWLNATPGGLIPVYRDAAKKEVQGTDARWYSEQGRQPGLMHQARDKK